MISAWIIFKPKTHGTKQETLRGAEEGGGGERRGRKRKETDPLHVVVFVQPPLALGNSSRASRDSACLHVLIRLHCAMSPVTFNPRPLHADLSGAWLSFQAFLLALFGRERTWTVMETSCGVTGRPCCPVLLSGLQGSPMTEAELKTAWCWW